MLLSAGYPEVVATNRNALHLNVFRTHPGVSHGVALNCADVFAEAVTHLNTVV